MSTIYYSNNESTCEIRIRGKKVRLEDFTFKSDFLHTMVEGVLGTKLSGPKVIQKKVNSVTLIENHSDDSFYIRIEP